MTGKQATLSAIRNKNEAHKMTGFSSEITKAIGAHGMWKLRLKTAISSGTADLSVSKASSDCECAFGKWLHGPELDAQTRSGMPYRVVLRLHREFHHAAGQVVAAVERGNRAVAQDLLDGEFTARSEKLVRALTKWKGEVA